ncbi:terminase small subunit [Klebsiella phage Geezett]|uniref:Terminase small subunit n=1 Tax=Klebsiella phage Geezett TaxID=2861002 RepID=A0AAE8AUA3_9CAUD|nr:terminase small subunit [Klebsiella phage Geezett]QXV72074.1 terminase small subunit [Klebsiella phage Geezett]
MARPLNEFGVTEQQEKFCRVFVETGNASEAYRQAYNAKNMGANTIAARASEMLNKSNITVRLQQLREVHQKRHNVTVDSLVAELEEIKNVALSAETPQSSAAVAAVLGKAKLMGLDKQLVQLSGGLDNTNTNINITAEDVKVFKKAFNDEF